VTAATEPLESGPAGPSQDSSPERAAGAPDTPAAPGTPNTPGSPNTPDTSDTPGTPTRRRRWGLILGLIGAGVLVLALLALGTLAFSARAAADAPQVPVKKFLTLLEQGHATAALRLDGTKVTASDVLLTDKAYQAAKERPSEIEILKATTSGNTATVTARYVLDGEIRIQKFLLEKTGTDLLVIPRWKLTPVPLGMVTVAWGGPQEARLAVSGITVNASPANIRLRALPGEYSTTLAAPNAWYTAAAGSAWVNGFGDANEEAADMTAALTPAGVTSATAAVNAWVAACVASTSLEPAGCSFGVDNSPPDPARDFSNQKWTLRSSPQFSVGGWSATGWLVTNTTSGSTTFFADAVDNSGPITFASVGAVPLAVGGTVTDITAAGATFVSQTWTDGPDSN
jgi:hypothetical protein